jgi:triacylglycerol lipase
MQREWSATVNWRGNPVLGARLRMGALSPRRRRFVAVSVAAVVLAVGVLAGPAVVSRLDRNTPTGFPAQDRLGTVLLVPGYGGGTDSLDALAARIRAAGRQAQVVQLPDSGTGDLSVAAKVLDDYVARALLDAPSVDVIGFSAGGVVTRLWVEQYDGAAKARRVITLGSPFHGTTVASAGAAADPNACPTACQQLIPGSSLLTSLDADAPAAGHPPWLSLWTTQDQTVVPPTSAELSGAVSLSVQSVCPGEQVAHGQLPTDPVVVGIVLRALGTGPIASADAASCTALRALSR